MSDSAEDACAGCLAIIIVWLIPFLLLFGCWWKLGDMVIQLERIEKAIREQRKDR